MREHQKLGEIIYNWFVKNGGGGGFIGENVYQNGKPYVIDHLREVCGRINGKEYFFQLGRQPLPYPRYKPEVERIVITKPEDFLDWAEALE